MDSDIEHIMDQLKKARSIAKGNVTRKANKVNEILTSCDNVDSVKEIAKELDEVLKHFEVAHEAYHNLLKEEHEVEESKLYFNSVNELVSEHRTKIQSWLEQPAIQLGQESQNQIQPEDSISTAGSHKSSRFQTRSIATSVRSSSSARARAAAKQAALEAKANALNKLHELQLEELKIKQKKSQVELQAEIAAVEAEKHVYEQSEASDVNSNRSARSRHVAAKSIQQHVRANKPASLKPHATENSLRQREAFNSQQLNPTTPEWTPASALPHDHSFQRLMETQDRQNVVLQQMIQQQMQGVTALTLPQPTMKIFNGDPIEYCDFIRSFEHLVETKTPSSSSRLYYLVQYTSGPAQELMKSCLSMEPEKGYNEARRLLKERYGQSFRIAAAHIGKLTEGPPIKAEDGNGLLQFSIQLTSCTNTLKEIGSLTKLDHPENLRKIINRLPFGMRLKWRDVVDGIVAKQGRDVTINDVTEFVTVKARAATHPVFGKIVNENKGRQEETKGKRTHDRRANGFATQGDHKAGGKDQDGRTCKNICPCNENHWLARCGKFRKMSLDQRMKFVKNKRLCLNCFNAGHFVRSCPKESFCKIEGCTGKHSTFLHPKPTPNDHEDKKPLSNQATKEETEGSTNSANNGYVRRSPNREQLKKSSVTGLAVVPVRVRVKGCTEMVETYAFLDSGSNTSFCTEGLLKALNNEGRKAKLSLTTMLGEGAPVECSLVEMEVFDLDQRNHVDLPKVYSTKSLPIRAECIGRQEDIERWPYLKGITIRHIDADVGLLIGSDVPKMLQPEEVRMSKNGGPFATKTLFGWVLNGPLGREDVDVPTANPVQADSTLEQRFEEFCNMEFNDVNRELESTMSQNDKKALNIMEGSVKLVNGHYEIGMPWKKFPPYLPNNMPQAQRRLGSLKRRLQQDPSLLEKYKKFMDNLFLNDYARKATTQDIGPLKSFWYLPHHPVFHPQKPEKIRVVFDCSAKYRDTSLNDQLLQGPDLTNTLVGVLTRFREEPVAMMADIEAMFYQVRVPSSDCDALRFLWWPDGDLSKDPEEYEMRVHLFGGASSPSCANFALKRTAKDNQAEFDPKVIETVERNFYVDDCLKSVSEEEEAVNLSQQLRELLARGGFKLTKWLSNSRRVVEAIPESERASIVKNLDFNCWSVERALGTQWNISSDQFGFSIVIKDRPPSRRGILSIISSVYDPLGFAAPFVFQANLSFKTFVA
ncbi:uncharacterized protein LOC114529553 [Dendronephthya gigantea]|uniref:uncharacterized protein LOC114529553 n=2 Tax=Dendronephthya gigantea TaxID=151771 RepID=UPI00106BDDAE|nr:uncharacterized protein LOC114529553 [Dendronephthya gigantea]